MQTLCNAFVIRYFYVVALSISFFCCFLNNAVYNKNEYAVDAHFRGDHKGKKKRERNGTGGEKSAN